MKRIILSCEHCKQCVQVPVEKLWCAPFIPQGSIVCHKCGFAVYVRIVDDEKDKDVQ